MSNPREGLLSRAFSRLGDGVSSTLPRFFSRGRLLAPQSREPYLVGTERVEQRLNFPQLAAVGWICAV